MKLKIALSACLAIIGMATWAQTEVAPYFQPQAVRSAQDISPAGLQGVAEYFRREIHFIQLNTRGTDHLGTINVLFLEEEFLDERSWNQVHINGEDFLEQRLTGSLAVHQALPFLQSPDGYVFITLVILVPADDINIRSARL